jgi:hypothetical protein
MLSLLAIYDEGCEIPLIDKKPSLTLPLMKGELEILAHVFYCCQGDLGNLGGRGEEGRYENEIVWLSVESTKVITLAIVNDTFLTNVYIEGIIHNVCSYLKRILAWITLNGKKRLL